MKLLDGTAQFEKTSWTLIYTNFVYVILPLQQHRVNRSHSFAGADRARQGIMPVELKTIQ